MNINWMRVIAQFLWLVIAAIFVAEVCVILKY